MIFGRRRDVDLEDDPEEPMMIRIAGFDQGYQSSGRRLDVEGVTISRLAIHSLSSTTVH